MFNSERFSKIMNVTYKLIFVLSIALNYYAASRFHQQNITLDNQVKLINSQQQLIDTQRNALQECQSTIVIIQDKSENDLDDDGFVGVFRGGHDCHDDDPDINPMAIELPDNLIDENCDGILLNPPQ